MNELIARNPDSFKDIDLSEDISQYNIEIPINDLVKYDILTEEQIKGTNDSILRNIKKWFIDKKWNLKNAAIITDRKEGKIIQLKTKDLDTFIELTHDTDGSAKAKKAG